MRLLCYVMETDNVEVLTPICVSLTNLAERQLHPTGVEARAAGRSRHGGQSPWASWWDREGGPLCVPKRSSSSQKHPGALTTRLRA